MANEQNLKNFPKGTSGNPSGRPRKFVSTLKAQGYSRGEIDETLKVLLTMTQDELKDIAANTECTALERTVAKALSKAVSYGQLGPIETLLSRAFGAPKQKIDNDVTVKQLPDWIHAAKSKPDVSGGEPAV